MVGNVAHINRAQPCPPPRKLADRQCADTIYVHCVIVLFCVAPAFWAGSVLAVAPRWICIDHRVFFIRQIHFWFSLKHLSLRRIQVWSAITARSSQYSFAPTLRGLLPHASIQEGRLWLIASKCSPHFSQAATASSSSLSSLQVHRISPAPLACCFLASSITCRIGFPIFGYSFAHKHPSKSMAIAF